MLISSIFCFTIFIISAQTNHNNDQCTQKIDDCKNDDEVQQEDFQQQKLLFYDTNPAEGFNLRRDVYMRFAIMLVEARKRGERDNWHLILPPWHALYHWKTESYHEPAKPWSMFFDLLSLRSFAPVLELHKIMQNSGNYGLKIDSLYVLKNYDNPFEDGDFRDKWNIIGPCKYDGRFWGYRNITSSRTICVQFLGDIKQLWDIVALHPEDTRVMFHHGEIPLHSSYGTKTYWDCRKSMRFNSELIEEADTYIVKELKCTKIHCSNFLALHWRRQDFLQTNRCPSIKGTAEQIHKTINTKSLKIKDIFVASDGSEQELKLLEIELAQLGYKTHYYLPDVSKYVDGQIAIIEQIICSRAGYFIGTHESTFTYRIQEEREILGFDSDTTFNRLCPDNRKCEKPSRWTIVH